MNARRTKESWRCGLLLLAFWLSGLMPATGAEARPNRDDELRRKTEEVERLKQELQRAQDQLRQLKADNERLRKEQAQPPRPVPAAPAKPLTPIATLPPVSAGQMVDLDELVGHFRADPAAADARYTKKTFRIKGAVARFEPALALRNYDVVLASPDPLVAVVCNFRYLERFRSVYTKHKGQTLVARTGPQAEHKLLQVGDTVVVQGKCHGFKNGQITMTGCELVKSQGPGAVGE